MIRFILRAFHRIRTAMPTDPALAALDARINALLPPVYRGCYAGVSPSSMGSAKIKYGPDGKVAWDDIWTTYCDLALAGGPPHRGTLLPAVPADAVTIDPARYRQVVAEIERAVRLTTLLPTVAVEEAGWVGVECPSEPMAAWVRTAVVAENVSCRRRGTILHLPAGPAFRVEKEIKNVTVALAKACHYWDGHLSDAQRGTAETHADVWEPATAADDEYRATVEIVSARLETTGRPVVPGRYVGWVGIEVGEDAAVWLLRAVVAGRVLARREGSTLYLPVGPTADAEPIARVATTFAEAWRLWQPLK